MTNAQTVLAAEETESAPTDEAPPPPPAQKPSSSADNGAPTVNTVKTVSIAPPRPTKPHDGAMALGAPADEPQGTGEWMETKTAVDMHAKAEQSSDTVKVAQGGVKMRVMARQPVDSGQRSHDLNHRVDLRSLPRPDRRTRTVVLRRRIAKLDFDPHAEEARKRRLEA
ncbi:MAG: hypothetical protein R3D01_03930 [Hyphomicrobiales bacterium]